MASRLTTAASVCIGKHGSPSLRTRFHGSASNPLHKFISYPTGNLYFSLLLLMHTYNMKCSVFWSVTLVLLILVAGLRYPIRAIHGATAEAVAPKKAGEEKSYQDWKIKMLYDGECPLCMREVWVDQPSFSFNFGFWILGFMLVKWFSYWCWFNFGCDGVRWTCWGRGISSMGLSNLLTLVLMITPLRRIKALTTKLYVKCIIWVSILLGRSCPGWLAVAVYLN